MPDVKLSQLPAASPATAAAGAALWTHREHIAGLKPEYVSANSLRVTTGSAFIQSLGYAVNVPAAITKSSLSLATNTWYHIYLFLNAGAPDIEIVTTAPAAPYSGTSRAKTGDTSRRYLGSVRTKTASTDLHKWIFDGGREMLSARYLDAPEPVRILSTGTATTITTVSAAVFAPVTSRRASLRINNAGDSLGRISNSEVLGNATPNTTLLALPIGSIAILDFPLDGSQALVYWFNNAPTSGGLIIDVLGYTLER